MLPGRLARLVRAALGQRLDAFFLDALDGGFGRGPGIGGQLKARAVVNLQAAIRQDYAGFAKTELQHRRETGLPPYTRMARVILRDQNQLKLHKLSEEVAAMLAEAAGAEGDAVKMRGPMPCAISRIAGYYRNQIVLQSATAAPLQHVLSDVREKGGLAKSDRIAVDVDPVSLL